MTTEQAVKEQDNIEKEHIIFYSGGLGSFATAYRVYEKLGSMENITLLFTDTLIESNDLYRFIIETAGEFYKIDKELTAPLAKKALEIPELYEDEQGRKDKLEELRLETIKVIPKLIWLSDGIQPWDIFFHQKFLGNSRIAQCSSILKQKMSAKYVREHYDPEKTVLYLGIDWTEEHRVKAPRKNWSPYPVEFPMCEEPYLTKIDFVKQLEKVDIEPCVLYEQKFFHANCYHGDTKFLTDEGTFTFKEKVGESVRVLGFRNHWQEATINSFGVQNLWKLHLKRASEEKVIEVTPDHRWFRKSKTNKKEIEREVFTKELNVGDVIPSRFTFRETSVKPSPVGIMHGIVFGDGTYPRNSWNNPATVTLCGDKVELKKFFHDSHDIKEVKGVGEKVTDLPKYFKDLPDLNESKSYLKGWLMGYIATDGSMSNGSATLSSSKLEDLEFVKEVCNLFGVRYTNIHEYWRKGFNDYETPLYTLNFYRDEYFETLLIREKHKEAYQVAVHDIADWVVTKVEPTDKYEEVYCATVPNGEEFTLDGNIRTMNCGGFCVRAGQGHFVNLLEQNPQLFLYHETKEQEIRKHIGKDVAIMRKQKNKVKFPYTLRMLREDYEKENEIDMQDIGGCGCFVNYDENDEIIEIDFGEEE